MHILKVGLSKSVTTVIVGQLNQGRFYKTQKLSKLLIHLKRLYMCGRYGQTRQGIESFAIERKYSYKRSQLAKFIDTYNLSPGNVTCFFKSSTDKGTLLEMGNFGYRPFFKPSIMWLNARAEGKEDSESLNQYNESDYNGAYNIGRSRAFTKAIKHHRCLLPVDYFIEGPEKEKLGKPYQIIRKDKNPFSLAGIYSYIEENYNVGIVTTAAAPLLKKVGHHRSPFVLERHQENIWLDHELSYNEIEKLFAPFDSSEFEAYPINPELRPPNRYSKPNNSPDLINPIGKVVL